MKSLQSTPWLFYSLESVSILIIVLALFGRQMISKLKWGGSRLRWSYLRDASNSALPSWDWLARWTGKWHGYARTLTLSGICFFVVAMVGMTVFDHKLEEYPVVEMHNVEVEQAVGDLSYWFVNDQGKRLYATFCDTLGYPPPFDRGETILVLKFKNRGTCWDMHDVHPKYVMLRDSDGNLIIKEN